MARCPFATWEPRGTPGGPISPRTVIVHSEATTGGLAKPTGGPLEWHFMVRTDGRILQHVDTQRRADANNKANAFAVSIETEDDGQPDREPWTDAQLWALERLIRWICTAHRIPLRRCPSWQQGGIGYHTMFGAPSPWTPVVKTCPGKVRIEQFNRVLLPRLTGEGDELTPTEYHLLVDAWVMGSYALKGQQPDADGVAYWIGRHAAGLSLDEVRTAILAA